MHRTACRRSPVIGRRIPVFVAATAYWAALAAFSTQLAADVLYWDTDGNFTTTTGGQGTWDLVESLWRLNSPTGNLQIWSNTGGDVDAFFGGSAATVNLDPFITFSVNDIFVAPTTGTAYTIASPSTATLLLAGPTRSTIDVAGGASLTITANLAGLAGFTKTGDGTLALDSAAGLSNFSLLLGGITVNGGTLQAGSTTNHAAAQALRFNAVTLASGTSLTTAGTTTELRVGQLSGGGSVAPAGTGAVSILALADATFSGTITTSSTGGLNLRGAYGTTQTFNGNLTALAGPTGANSGATIRLTGTGDATSGVLGANSLTPRGGTIVLDNTAGNTAAGAGRLADSASFVFLGGEVSLLGHADGTSETVGGLTLNAGAATIRVTHNGGASGTVLAFTDSGSLRNETQMTVDFVGLGGTLGAAGANPRITFSGAVSTNTTNGMLASTNGATTTTIGWATVNGTNWAGISANGIVALADVARDSSTLGSAASWELAELVPSEATTIVSANLRSSAAPLGALKISPSGTGQTLAVGTNTIFTPAVMLTGSTDFTITGTTGGFGIGSGTRYVYVTEAATTLFYGASFPSTGPLNKSGPGTFALTRTSGTQIPAANVNVLQGVLRSTVPAIGGTSGLASSAINFRGGVLEIDAGGSSALFRPAIGVATGTGGGIVSFDDGAALRGDGGFSAFNGNATVTLVTSRGGSTQASLVWNSNDFLANGYVLLFGSAKSDGRIELNNNLGLDGGSAGSTYYAREMRVADNTSSAGDFARLSGLVSGSIHSDLLKTGPGILELTNASNTFSGGTIVHEGTLLFSGAGALGSATAAYVVVGSQSGALHAALKTSHASGTLAFLRAITVNSGGTGAATLGNAVAPDGTTAGDATFGGNITVGLPGDTTAKPLQLDAVAGTTVTFSGAIVLNTGYTGAASVTKIGGGAVILSGVSTYTGGTTVSTGTLTIASGGSIRGNGNVAVAAGATLNVQFGGVITSGGSVTLSGNAAVNGSVASPVVVNSGGLLSGTGSIAGLTVNPEGTVSPGNSVGQLTVADGAANFWNGGSTLYFEFNNASNSGSPGTDWDYLNLGTGGLEVNADSGNRITLRIDSFNGGAHGEAANFDPNGTYSWLFLSAGGGISFNAGSDVFTINDSTAGFGAFGAGNPFSPVAGRGFFVSQVENNLYINYGTVPEPGSLTLVFFAASGGYALRARRRRTLPPRNRSISAGEGR